MRCRVALALLLVLAGCASRRTVETRREAAGPFTIETRVVRISSGGFPNNSGDPFATMPVTYFGVEHAGRPVAVTADGVARDEFWDAWLLPAAPQPALLLADTGMYLVTLRDGAATTQVVIAPTSSMATYQWLDADAGQPGPERTVGIRDGSAEPRALAGGSLLLLGGRCVLDVPTLGVHCVSLNDLPVLQRLDDYTAAGTPARGLSPTRSQLVFVGSRQRGTTSEWAVVVVDFRTGDAYALPIDRDAMRFEEPDDATGPWLARWFAWTTRPDGTERLARRRGVTPPPWEGRLSASAGGYTEYRLVPVRAAAMQAAFTAFLQQRFGAALVREDDDTTLATIDGSTLTVWARPDARTVAVFARQLPTGSTQPASDLVARVAAAFDAELRAGRHQDCFTAWPDAD